MQATFEIKRVDADFVIVLAKADATDADALLEEAILEVANDESGDIFDNTTPLIAGVTFEVWKATNNLLKEVFSE